MKLLALSLALCLFPGTLRSQDLRAAPTAKLHPDLLRVIAEHGPAKGWVFFTDKRLDGPAARTAALDEARARLSPRTLERRRARRVLPGLVDERDAALARPYVEAVRATGAELVLESPWLNAISVRGTAEQFRAIAALACVERVQPVRRGVLIDADAPGRASEAGFSASTGGGRAALGLNYGNTFAQLDQIGVIGLHARGYTADNVVVGILDTGFHRGHEAFNQVGHVVQIVAEHDFVDGDGNTDIEAGDPSSQHSHGTYILGTLGAYLPGSLVGGAYDASFILCKTEDTTNEYQQEEDFYVAGLQFIESNGGDMATSSLGYIDWYTQSDLDGLTAVTTVAVNVATDNGMPCLTAAGNSGHDTNPATSTLIAPADALAVITAGAVDSAGTIASFSSEGPSADGRVKPELLGTGVATWTVCAFTDSGCTTQVSGTSLSTPVLASMVACLIDARPDWTVGQLRARLFRTGNYFLANNTFDPQFVLGYGIPDGEVAAFDCNGNGIDDDLDIAGGSEKDCNGNGYPDSCDLADGISSDANGNSIPDECPDSFRPAGPPSGSATVALPFTALPPAPRPGGRVRASLGPVPHGGLPFVLVRVNGAVLGLTHGARLETGARVLLEQPLPDDMALLGLALELRGGLFQASTGQLSWSRTLVLR
jgi:subtilase family protein